MVRKRKAGKDEVDGEKEEMEGDDEEEDDDDDDDEEDEEPFAMSRKIQLGRAASERIVCHAVSSLLL